jgi:hypothetical protein
MYDTPLQLADALCSTDYLASTIGMANTGMHGPMQVHLCKLSSLQLALLSQVVSCVVPLMV